MYIKIHQDQATSDRESQLLEALQYLCNVICIDSADPTQNAVLHCLDERKIDCSTSD